MTVLQNGSRSHIWSCHICCCTAYTSWNTICWLVTQMNLDFDCNKSDDCDAYNTYDICNQWNEQSDTNDSYSGGFGDYYHRDYHVCQCESYWNQLSIGIYIRSWWWIPHDVSHVTYMLEISRKIMYCRMNHHDDHNPAGSSNMNIININSQSIKLHL